MLTTYTALRNNPNTYNNHDRLVQIIKEVSPYFINGNGRTNLIFAIDKNSTELLVPPGPNRKAKIDSFNSTIDSKYGRFRSGVVLPN